MPSPYNILFNDLSVQQDKILSSYDQATTELSNNGMPTTAYMDLRWDRDAGKIYYIPTDNRIQDESQQIQYKYYYQLDQLFALATRNLIYTA
jgi:hypothetical protein